MSANAAGTTRGARRAAGVVAGALALGLSVGVSGPAQAATGTGTGTSGGSGNSGRGSLASVLQSALSENAIGDTLWGDKSGSGKPSAVPAGSWDQTSDLGSMYSLTRDAGVQSVWARGYTGKGVTVAVIDTGIAPVAGLDSSGKVTDGPDLSYEGQSAGTRYLDGYGHGTHMAGIIAGKDDKFDPKNPSRTLFAGVAPDARLLNLRVGTGDGGADVTQVIAALDWLVQHRTDDGMNVRVVNLAYGTTSAQPWQVDPLAKAVENAWAAGIVVVAAAGNDGTAAPNLLMPAIDPHVIAVGAVDNQGTASTLDDTVASFTNGGSATRRPDVLAPGRSVVSLRVPNSYVDLMHPEGRVAGDASGRFFRGSGTSQATAVVSGEVALLLQARPNLTPDQAKALLRDTADRLTGSDPVAGAGVVDVREAISVLSPTSLLSSAVRLISGSPSLPSSSGTGPLEKSRGGEHVVDPSSGQPLVGEYDAQGTPWNGTTWAAASTARKAWNGGSWNGRTWTGTGFSSHDWAAAPWTGTSWNGVPWSAHTWSDASWQARSWRTGDWLARSWREASWQARSWRGMGG